MAVVEQDGTILIRNNYDEAGRLTSSVGKLGGTSHSVTLGYDGFGRRTSITHSNGVTGAYTIDSADRITNIAWSGGISKTEDITYDKDSLIKQIVRDIGTFNYGYSQKNEITSISYSGSETLNNLYVNTTLTQDKAGNITAYHGDSFGIFDNFVRGIGNIQFWPDQSGRGQMIGERSSNDTKSMIYYPDGHIKDFEKRSSGTLSIATSYFYDGLGRRIAKKKSVVSSGNIHVFNYYHLGLEEKILSSDLYVNTTSSVTSTSLFADAQGIDDHLFEINSGTGAKPYAKDHLGSILNSSALGGKSVYGLYGENLGSAPSVESTEPVMYGFTGRELDVETSYYYYRARYFDPKLARFLTKDPKGHDAGDTNFYRYVKNNPVGLVDPKGENPLLIAAGVGGAVSAGIDLGVQLAQNGGSISGVDWGSVGTAFVVGAAISTLMPTGALFGRGGERAAQFGYSESAGLLNRGATRIGWSGPVTGADVISLRTGAQHLDMPALGSAGFGCVTRTRWHY
ncbi:MAG: hypothetical protein A4S09_16235 [Proteobacteria bacterium SG_bin7]|nr:MAG: hypothetical protein A4S09_16235 [Proteobacteria bacterium SG_bin7]